MHRNARLTPAGRLLLCHGSKGAGPSLTRPSPWGSPVTGPTSGGTATRVRVWPGSRIAPAARSGHRLGPSVQGAPDRADRTPMIGQDGQPLPVVGVIGEASPVAAPLDRPRMRAAGRTGDPRS
jgi:hypothetical protein